MLNFEEVINSLKLINGLEDFQFQPEGMDWASTIVWQIMEWMLSMVVTAVMSIFELCYEGITTLYNVNNYLSNPEAITNGIADIATLVLIIFFLKHIFINYILDLDGESDADPMQVLVNLSVAIAVINCAGEIHNFFMNLSSLSVAYIGDVLTESTINLDISSKDITMHFLKTTVGTLALTVPGINSVVLLVGVIWLIVVGILMVVLAFKIIFRGVELFIFQCLMPLFACDLITTSKELWKPFFKAYLITIFGWLIQYTCLMLSVVILLDVASPQIGIQGLMSPLVSTVMLYFACKAPKWLQSFTYQTGAGQVASSGARGIVSGASQVISAARAIK